MAALLRDDMVASVLAQYHLSGARVVAQLEASKRNENLLVEDLDGRRYVLRRYRRNPDERRVRFQLEFQKELFRLGYPTSEIIPSNTHDLLVDAEHGLWVLFSFVEGSEYDFANMGQVVEAGRRLAEFHTTTTSIEMEEVVLDINPPVKRWWTHGEEEVAALAALFHDQVVDDELAFLRNWNTQLVRRWSLAQLEALPAGWVHSDFHGRNMVFLGDELRGLFDFDPLHRGFWVEDIAHALFMFSREFRGSTRIRPDVAQLFLDAYQGRRSITDGEREAIPIMAALVWAPSAPYQQLHLRDGEGTLAFFRHYVQLMRDLESEMERLALP